jgi:hypothetical protein
VVAKRFATLWILRASGASSSTSDRGAPLAAIDVELRDVAQEIRFVDDDFPVGRGRPARGVALAGSPLPHRTTGRGPTIRNQRTKRKILT